MPQNGWNPYINKETCIHICIYKCTYIYIKRWPLRSTLRWLPKVWCSHSHWTTYHSSMSVLKTHSHDSSSFLSMTENPPPPPPQLLLYPQLVKYVYIQIHICMSKYMYIYICIYIAALLYLYLISLICFFNLCISGCFIYVVCSDHRFLLSIF
jgi:hypothetical protein